MSIIIRLYSFPLHKFNTKADNKSTYWLQSAAKNGKRVYCLSLIGSLFLLSNQYLARLNKDNNNKRQRAIALKQHRHRTSKPVTRTTTICNEKPYTIRELRISNG